MSIFLTISISALCATIFFGTILAFFVIKHTHKPVKSSPYCIGGLQNGDQTLESIVDSLVLCNSNFDGECR